MITDIAERLTSRWWTFVLRGVVALALAVFAFSAPGTLAALLVYIVGAFFIVSGLVALYAGVSLTGVGHWWLLILTGVAQGFLGIVMLSQPGAGPLALAYLVALWAFSTGFMEIGSAIALRNYVKDEFWWILLGAITLAFGVYVVIRPDLGILALVYGIAIYAVLAGVTLIALGLRIRNTGREISGRRATTTPAGAAPR
jgi:uncharacterized membrane protein HdeD (DUF308 family)